MPTAVGKSSAARRNTLSVTGTSVTLSQTRSIQAPNRARWASSSLPLMRSRFAVRGSGDGRADEIPAMLSDGEYVIDAETVALLGNGSSEAGAKVLDRFRVNVRKHKGKELSRGKFSVKAKSPEAYLGGRV